MIKRWFGLTKMRENILDSANYRAEKTLLRKNTTQKVQGELRQLDDIQYQLIRSDKRKTIGLQVKSGKVFVRAPCYVNESTINQFVLQKYFWVKGKIAAHNVANDVLPPTLFRDQGEIFIYGALKKIKVISGLKNSVCVDENFLVVSLCHTSEKLTEKQLALKIKKTLELWLKKQCEKYMEQQIPALSLHCQLFAKSYKIRRYKARWGSCNTRKELSLNYLLMMCPTWVIDYVIIHELCHTKEMNHSKKFWQLVGHYCPEYQQAKRWFKTNNHQLRWQ